MTRPVATAAVVFALMASAAEASEHRGDDAALGALTGAVVFGPVGAAAGALVGYTAGPSIAQSWGFRPSHAARQARKTARNGRSAVPLPTPRAAAIPQAAAQPATSAQAPAAPPVQALE